MPCKLPALPRMPVVAGATLPDDPQRIVFTKAELAELTLEREQLVAWIRAANGCLTSGAP